MEKKKLVLLLIKDVHTSLFLSGHSPNIDQYYQCLDSCENVFMFHSFYTTLHTKPNLAEEQISSYQSYHFCAENLIVIANLR